MITDTIDQLTTVERQQGRDEGKTEGKLEVVRQGFELVLSRPLTEAESIRLGRHIELHGVDLTTLRTMRGTPAEIEAWLRPQGPNGMAIGGNGHDDG